MRSIHLEITLEAPVVQTAEPTTSGPHRSLEYIRGSNFLGAAAASLYESLEDHAFTAFHSGMVRFGDARPRGQDGLIAIPAPLDWYRDKNATWRHGDSIAPEGIQILSRDARLTETAQQVRGGFFTAGGLWHNPPREYRLKVAIDRERRGRARDGHLFGYEALPAGSTWVARIDLDEEVPTSIEEALRTVFDDRPLWLGRSKAAEYGRARSRLIEEPQGEGAKRDPESARDGVAVYLESDVSIYDGMGSPAREILPASFGIPDSWRYAPELSSVDLASYSPWNAHRWSYDFERFVIRRGSVLVFRPEDPQAAHDLDLRKARERVLQGVGAWRQDGLGRVRLDPWFLCESPLAFEREVLRKDTVEPPSLPLVIWMQAERDRSMLAIDDLKGARELARDIARKVEALRREKKPTPSKSQWQQLAAVAKEESLRLSPAIERLRGRLADTVFADTAALNMWDQEIRTLLLKVLETNKPRTAARRLYLAARDVVSSKKNDAEGKRKEVRP